MPKKQTKKIQTRIIILIIVFIVFVAGFGGGFVYQKFNSSKKQIQERVVAEDQPKELTQEISADDYLVFLEEIYDLIMREYWDKITDADLIDLYKRGAEKLAKTEITTELADKEALMLELSSILQNLKNDKRKEFSVNLGDVVLANLKPFKRSRLYTKKLEKDLTNRVTNIDPETNLYDELGVKETASQDEIKETYKEKKKELGVKIDKVATEEEKKKVQQEIDTVERAREALGDQSSREIYDKTGIEPTITSPNLIGDNVFYLKINRISPQTFEEFKQVANQADASGNEDLNSLIIDLRGNVGGSVDLLPYFLGPFVGPNTVAYEFFKKGEYEPFRTKTGWLPSLVRYKKVVVLIDENAQSSAEIMAASLKKYHVGVIIGRTTKGWGTIERVFPLENQISSEETYSVFLVHSITVRDDGQPIEGRGVDPTISIDDENWREQLMEYFNFEPLVNAVEQVWQER